MMRPVSRVAGMLTAVAALPLAPTAAYAAPAPEPNSPQSTESVNCVSKAGGTDENHVVITCSYTDREARGVGDCNGLQPDIFTAWIIGTGRSTSADHCINGATSTHVES